MTRSLVPALLPLLLALGCNPPAAPARASETAHELDVAAKPDDNLALPAPGDSAGRLYFDSDQYPTATADQPLSYWVFTARGHQSFTVEVRAVDHDDDDLQTITTDQVGFKLYRLARVGRHLEWKLISSADGPAGDAKLSSRGASAHYYMVEATGGALPVDLVVHLGCDAGDHRACVLGGQPRDACGTLAKSYPVCDDGLYCQSPVGACGDEGIGEGTCVVQPTSCPEELACWPVCGCDGTTYCSGCNVAANGASLLHQGACDCDQSVYTPGPFAVSGTFGYIDPKSQDHYSYTFSGRAGFTSTHEFGCRFTTPACAIATQERHGTYSLGGDVTLTYDSGDTATLQMLTNCTGAGELVGTDYGNQLTLTPTPTPAN